MWRAEHMIRMLFDPLKYVGQNKMKNVYGNQLESCSSPGMAITGYTRSGSCTDNAGDTGSHHICVKNIDGGDSGENFCQITNQKDWCSEKGTCHGNPSNKCDRKKWCVCEWAFDSFVNEKGCDAFDIDCDATNELVLKHYEEHDKKDALKCIQQKCKI